VGAITLSPEFEANDLGFVSSADEVRVSSSLSYQRFRPDRVFRSWVLEAVQGTEWTYGGERMDAALGLIGRFQLLNYWGAQLRTVRSGSALDPWTLRGGPALRTPARDWGSLSIEGDPRAATRVALDVDWSHAVDGGARAISLNPTLTVRPSDRTELSLGPSLAWNRDPAQYVGAFDVAGRPEYVLGRIGQTTSSLTLRLDYTFRPTLSLQLYAEPFISAGRFAEFRTVRDPHAARFADRFHTLGARELTSTVDRGARRHAVDLDGDHTADLRFADPSFNVKQLNSNAVLRWEYRPGSTLFVVWGQARSQSATDGRYLLRRDATALLRAPSTNVLAIKASYWLGM
jgi:hypothetical protein